jgi:hypothetical protein
MRVRAREGKKCIRDVISDDDVGDGDGMIKKETERDQAKNVCIMMYYDYLNVTNITHMTLPP